VAALGASFSRIDDRHFALYDSVADPTESCPASANLPLGDGFVGHRA